jgi:glycosyltransferase involved in cell wall biosynthesis
VYEGTDLGELRSRTRTLLHHSLASSKTKEYYLILVELLAIFFKRLMHYPNLSELPPPPAGKTGWPWTQESKLLPEQMPDGSKWPQISIVTPNYNCGRFLEETIRSVLLQGYPNLEYIVIDGGSTDNSVEIIKKYEPWLTYWVSEPDKGQVDAINKGLQRVTGQWFNWLNGDDILLSGSLKTLATISNLQPEANWITGTGLFLSTEGALVDYWVPWRNNPAILGLGYPSFPQDATFIRVEFMHQHDITLCPEISNVFDTLLQWILVKHDAPLLTSACFSAMRLHPLQKTANSDHLTRETERWLMPMEKTLPLLSRIWLRLLKTRFSKLFRSLLGLGVAYGITPTSRSWKAAVYDHKRYEWKIDLAKKFIFF